MKYENHSDEFGGRFEHGIAGGRGGRNEFEFFVGGCNVSAEGVCRVCGLES